MADRAGAGTPGPARGDRGRRPPDHRHVPQADRERRPRGAHRGPAFGHARLRPDGGVGGRDILEALRAARSRGYTEPDPREDLSGMDVGRKALILARLLGYQGELSARRSSRWCPSGRAAFRSRTFSSGSTRWTPPGAAGRPSRRGAESFSATWPPSRRRRSRWACARCRPRARSRRSRARTTSSCSPRRATRPTRSSSPVPARERRSRRRAC